MQSSSIDLPKGIVEAGTPVLVQAVLPELAHKAFVGCSMSRLALLDELEHDAPAVATKHWGRVADPP
ncbi:hypothetical protein [Congregibacter sp.]|uniref:hypothetical protein n=1 Tax=Congregibacter sp. TaxID=2744308 RepID=UPI0039E2F95E